MRNGKQQLFSSRFLLPLSIIFLLGVFFGFTDVLHEETTTSPIQAAPVFDGADTFGTTTVTATVVSSLPAITIEKPQNKTYENNESVQLQITVTNASSLPIDMAFYTIDDAENITLDLDSNNENTTTFSASQGSHILKVFANNTANELNSSSVDFFVNSSIRFEVNVSRYNLTIPSLSLFNVTNLSALNETQLQAIPEFVLEELSFGKIEFFVTINLTDDDLTDSPIDIDTFIDINNFSIFINKTIFSNLAEKPAALYFYNIMFSNPAVLRNGVACPTTICVAQTLVGQTLLVNVTNFSKYSVTEGSSGGGDSGGGGGGTRRGRGGGSAGGQRGALTSVTYNLDTIMEQTDILARISKIFVIWKGEEYSVRVGKPSANTILLDFTELGEKLILEKGQSITIDFDYDEEADGRFMIEDITANTFTLIVTSLKLREEQKIEQREEEPGKEEPSQKFLVQTAKKALLNKDLIGITIILIVAGIIVEMERRTKKKRKR